MFTPLPLGLFWTFIGLFWRLLGSSDNSWALLTFDGLLWHLLGSFAERMTYQKMWEFNSTQRSRGSVHVQFATFRALLTFGGLFCRKNYIPERCENVTRHTGLEALLMFTPLCLGLFWHLVSSFAGKMTYRKDVRTWLDTKVSRLCWCFIRFHAATWLVALYLCLLLYVYIYMCML